MSRPRGRRDRQGGAETLHWQTKELSGKLWLSHRCVLVKQKCNTAKGTHEERDTSFS